MTSRVRSRAGYEWRRLSYDLNLVRIKASRKPLLVAGPYLGEFGYELMEWRPYALSIARRYKEARFISAPGREVLYRPYRFIGHDADLRLAGYGFGTAGAASERRIAFEIAASQGMQKDDFDLLIPTSLTGRFGQRLFKPVWTSPQVTEVELGRAVRSDIVFHFRDIQKEGPDERINLSPRSADLLVRACNSAGWTSACIGDPRYAICPAGCIDLRSHDLFVAVAAIKQSSLFVGQLSGPAHLAHLVGKPVVTWANGEHRFKIFPSWNPHGAGLLVVSTTTYDPAVPNVLAMIARILETREE